MTEGIETVDALLDVLSLLGFSDSDNIAGSLREASQVCNPLKGMDCRMTFCEETDHSSSSSHGMISWQGQST